MWASSAATEIMKTPWSESIETSIRSRRTALTGAPAHPTFAPLWWGKSRLRSSRRLSQQIGAGIGAVEGLGEPLRRLFLLLGQLLRHRDLQPVADVAATAAPGLRRPLAAQTLDRAVLGPLADLDLLRPLQGRHLDRRPAQRLGNRDRHGDLEVAAVEPFEDRGGGGAGDDEEVARRPAALPGLALAGEADPRS